MLLTAFPAFQELSEDLPSPSWDVQWAGLRPAGTELFILGSVPGEFPAVFMWVVSGAGQPALGPKGAIQPSPRAPLLLAFKSEPLLLLLLA